MFLHHSILRICCASITKQHPWVKNFLYYLCLSNWNLIKLLGEFRYWALVRVKCKDLIKWSVSSLIYFLTSLVCHYNWKQLRLKMQINSMFSLLLVFLKKDWCKVTNNILQVWINISSGHWNLAMGFSWELENTTISCVYWTHCLFPLRKKLWIYTT